MFKKQIAIKQKKNKKKNNKNKQTYTSFKLEDSHDGGIIFLEKVTVFYPRFKNIKPKRK
jgi:hypothetical protein